MRRGTRRMIGAFARTDQYRCQGSDGGSLATLAV